jgi:hypothetical protein
MCLLETTQADSPIVWRGTHLKPINPPVKPAGRPPAPGEEDHLSSAHSPSAVMSNRLQLHGIAARTTSISGVHPVLIRLRPAR